jgi:hypothetical protein
MIITKVYPNSDGRGQMEIEIMNVRTDTRTMSDVPTMTGEQCYYIEQNIKTGKQYGIAHAAHLMQLYTQMKYDYHTSSTYGERIRMAKQIAMLNGIDVSLVEAYIN